MANERVTKNSSMGWQHDAKKKKNRKDSKVVLG